MTPCRPPPLSAKMQKNRLDVDGGRFVEKNIFFFKHKRETKKQVMMPPMVSIGDGAVSLSLYLAPVTISSEARADVPGDFAVSTDVGSMSKGGYTFSRAPTVTIANILNMRFVVVWLVRARARAARVFFFLRVCVLFGRDGAKMYAEGGRR